MDHPQPATIYTGGTFELLHAGHLHLLRRCRDLATDRGKVVVALNTDAFVERYKGRTTRQDWNERAALLGSLALVDLVVCNTGDEDSTVAIDVVRPQVIAIGDDWRGRDYHAQMGFDQAWLDTRGIEIVYVEHLPGHSSTALRA